jgi:hypothetical protein
MGTVLTCTVRTIVVLAVLPAAVVSVTVRMQPVVAVVGVKIVVTVVCWVGPIEAGLKVPQLGLALKL